MSDEIREVEETTEALVSPDELVEIKADEVVEEKSTVEEIESDDDVISVPEKKVKKHKKKDKESSETAVTEVDTASENSGKQKKAVNKKELAKKIAYRGAIVIGALLIVYVLVILSSFIATYVTNYNLAKAYTEVPYTAPEKCSVKVEELTIAKINEELNLTGDSELETLIAATIEEVNKSTCISRPLESTDLVNILDYINTSYAEVKELYKNEDGSYYVTKLWLSDAISAYIAEVAIAGLLMSSDEAINYLYEASIGDEVYHVDNSGLYQSCSLEMRSDYRKVLSNTDLIAELDNGQDKLYRVVEYGFDKLYQSAKTGGLNDLTIEQRRSMILPSSDNIEYIMHYLNYLQSTEDAAYQNIASREGSVSKANSYADVISIINPFSDLYTDIADFACIKAIRKSNNNFNEAETAYVKSLLNRDFWFWRYMAGELVQDENYMATVDNYTLYKSIIVEPDALMVVEDEAKRCAWVVSQETVYEQLNQLCAMVENTDDTVTANSYSALLAAIITHAQVVLEGF